MSFKECRRHAGLTQKDVASALSVSLVAVWQWETGQFTPSVKNLKKIAELYGCTIDELLKGE